MARRKADKLQDYLQPFRDLESLEDLAPAVDDPASIRLLASWPRIRVEWRPGKGKAPESSAERWTWLWSEVRLDVEQLGVATRLPRTTLDLCLRCAVEARLIYPDGSVHAHARRLVAAFTATRLPGRKQGRPKKGE